jgi:hypothetical protein
MKVWSCQVRAGAVSIKVVVMDVYFLWCLCAIASYRLIGIYRCLVSALTLEVRRAVGY